MVYVRWSALPGGESIGHVLGQAAKDILGALLTLSNLTSVYTFCYRGLGLRRVLETLTRLSLLMFSAGQLYVFI